MRRSPTVLALALFFTGACDMEEDELAVSSQAIVNGDTSIDDDAVVALVSNGRQFCSGTLISPRVIATAAHCVYPNVRMRPEDVQVVFGRSTDGPDETIDVEDGIAHEDWKKDAIPYDIGLLRLAEPAEADPVAVTGLGLKRESVVGEIARMVGFGVSRTEGEGNGVRRVGDMLIEQMDDFTLYLTPGPSATCNGDSGGPMFLPTEGGEVFAGIHSRSNCTDDSLNERVDVHLAEFIVPYVREAGDSIINADEMCQVDLECNSDCVYDADCENMDPVDQEGGGCGVAPTTPWGFLLFALVALGRRRRR